MHCCRWRSSRVPQILTRRSQSALGFEYCRWAAQNGHLHVLEYLVEREFNKYNEYACKWAAMFGRLDCLKYLHETKARGTLWPFEKRTRTTKPSVYNTFSTTTVLSHQVGDTSTARYCHAFTDKNKKNQSNTYNTQTHTHIQLKEKLVAYFPLSLFDETPHNK